MSFHSAHCKDSACHRPTPSWHFSPEERERGRGREKREKKEKSEEREKKEKSEEREKSEK
jgi:hypothetical protein